MLIVLYRTKKRETGEGNLSGFADRAEATDKDIEGTAMLPIPGGITSTDTVAWGSDKMDSGISHYNNAVTSSKTLQIISF